MACVLFCCFVSDGEMCVIIFHIELVVRECFKSYRSYEFQCYVVLDIVKCGRHAFLCAVANNGLLHDL